MISIIQRVTEAQVKVDNVEVGAIQQGILALVAVEKDDTEKLAERLLERVLNYRIFADDDGKMNLSLRAISGDLLIVPQFTLAANTQTGNRPSFTSAAPPEQGRHLFAYLQEQANRVYPHTQFGRFGADMQVALINDGPVTFTLRVI